MLQIPLNLGLWPLEGRRRISVNSFGFGGANAHVIMEDADQYRSANSLKISNGIRTALKDQAVNGIGEATTARRLFVVSSNDGDELKSMLRNLSDYIQQYGKNHENTFLNDLAFTLTERRSVLPWKAAVSASSAAELIESLQGSPSMKRSTESPRIGFVFTGQGAQWHAMARELVDTYPVFASTLAKADGYLRRLGASWSIFRMFKLPWKLRNGVTSEVTKTDELNRDAETTNVNTLAISQPLCTAIQIGLVDLLQSWGVLPCAVVGHSSGEPAAAYAANALTIEAALSISYFKGLLCSTISRKAPHLRGAMMAVGLSEKEAQQHISNLTLGYATIACINSPSSVTLSGDVVAIDELNSQLTSRGVFTRKLRTGVAYHSLHMQVIENDYLTALKNLKTNQWTSTPYWSSVTAQLIEATDLGAQYWVRHMYSPVRFLDSLRNMCLQSPQGGQGDRTARKVAIDFLIEIGPHSALAGPIRQVMAATELKNANIGYSPSLVRNKDATWAMLQLACTLFVSGYRLNMSGVNIPCSTSPKSVLVNLPSYAWKHNLSHWYESPLSTSFRMRRHPRHDLLGAPVGDFNDLAPRWRNIIRISDIPWVQHHQVQSSIIYPAAGYIAMAIEAARQCNLEDEKSILWYRFRNIKIKNALMIPDDSDGVETSFTLQPLNDGERVSSDAWREFRVYSYSKRDGWSSHCRGLVCVEHRDGSLESEAIEKQKRQSLNKEKFISAINTCKDIIDVEDLYRLADSIGLQFGSIFRNLVEVHSGINETLCKIIVPDTKAMMPKGFEYPHVIHPATLDAVIQTFIPSVMNGGTLEAAMVPISIKELSVAAHIHKNPGHQFSIHTTTKTRRRHESEAVMTVVDSIVGDMDTIVEITNLKCVSLGDTGKSKQRVESKKLCYKLGWEPDIDLLGFEEARRLCSTRLTDSDSLKILELEQVSLRYIQDALSEITEADYKNMDLHQQRYYEWMKLQDRQVSTRKHEITVSEQTAGHSMEINNIRNRVRLGSSDGRLLCTIGDNLVRILRKEIQPLELMLENELLSDFYATSLGVNRISIQLAYYIEKLIHKYPNMNILEIGAGTGGTTLPILQALGGVNGRDARFSHYTFTDVSVGFSEKAQHKFKEWGTLISYKKLDIESDPVQQGFQKEGYDLIVAAHVLHATRSMDVTMQNVRKLLKPNGKLLMLEPTSDFLRISLIFGSLQGWWLGEHLMYFRVNLS